VPGIDLQRKRLRRSITISGKSQSTLTNYARCLADMGLHLNCDLLNLDDEGLEGLAFITCPENRDLTQGPNPNQTLWHPSQCLQGNT